MPRQRPTSALPTDTKPSRTFAGKARFRMLASVLVTTLMVWGALALSPAWALLPIVGVAVAAVTMSVSKVTSRFAHPTCWTCGHDLSGEEPTPQGVACPDCGSINLNPDPQARLASRDDAANEPDRNPGQPHASA